MNIAVNTRLLQKNRLEGIGSFSCEMLKRITQTHPEHTFYFIFDRPFDKAFVFAKNVVPVVAGIPTRHPLLCQLWFEVTIPHVLKKLNANIFVSPDGYLSLRTNIPQIAVIHDINFVHQPKYLPLCERWYYNHYFPLFAQKAAAICTVSEFSKNDICQNFNINTEKITVCRNGSNSLYVPVNEDVKTAIRAKYCNGFEYFIFVGAINPRKNIVGLLRAYEHFRLHYKSEVKLLIVGSAMYVTSDVKRMLRSMRYSTDVIFMGHVPAERLHFLVSAAVALVYLSHFEGFGLPIVEAMNAETAIICANNSALTEVAGNAALTCKSTDFVKAAEYMNTLCTNASVRNSLIERGRTQRQRFSWDKSANLLWQCIATHLK